MKIEEVYEYFGKNWSKIMRIMGVCHNNYKYWQKIGYIPFSSQLLIERVTKGKLLADKTHAKPMDDIEKEYMNGNNTN